MHVEFQNITKRFGSVTAAATVSLRIESGEFFFLLGPSGCGKTTLLRILAGFEAPDEGIVLFDDKDVSTVPPEKRGTGLVFQNYALWPHLTVAQNITFGLEVRKLPAKKQLERLNEAMSLVRLRGLESRRPAQLSGGQQQRVALARALIIRPKLVLLDEPLSNLDAKLRLEMRTELREIIKQAGHTAVYVTHDQKEALSMADRIAIMNEGRIEQVGAARELYERPGNRFVAEFLGETNFLPAKVVRHEGNICHVRLQDSDTEWQGVSQDTFKPGDDVFCNVRPEAWKIGPSPEAVNLIEGNLKLSVYMGEATQHQVVPSHDANKILRILELESPAREPGPVTLWIRPEATVILRGT
jgi:iron(III) transport system ATP-binding protein